MARARLADVAFRAGVSTKTVSNVVNGTGSVGPAARKRVEAAITALDYRPNVTARRLATGHTGAIAVAVSSVTVPYFAEISSLIDRAAHRNGLRVVIEQTRGELARELAILEERERGLVDGVIFHPVSLTPAHLVDRRPGFPLVMLGEGPAPDLVDHVMIDNVATARGMTAHLQEQGRRRIAFLGAEPGRSNVTTAQRVAGYQDALRAVGSTVDEDLILPVYAFSPDEGYRVVSEALDKGTTFDGLVCRDDSLAAGALHALHAHGKGVPADVAVTGWDDLSITRHLWPPLTTMSPAKSEIAETAVRVLVERIGGFEGAGRHEVFDGRLIVRESTRGH